jgi:hypothetical protein
MRKCLKVEYLGRIEYDFQKSRVTGPWDHMVLVSAKKKKKFMLVYLYCTADFENAGYYFFLTGKLHNGPFQGIFRGGQLLF